MKVLVSSPCGKTPVCDSFYDCFYGLQLPEGSSSFRVKGGSVPANLNKIIDSTLEGGYTHVFIVEDDSMFPPNAVMKLLSHDKEVVTGLCRSRQPPFRPYVYEGLDPKTGLAFRKLTKEDKGLIKVAATGMGGILINTKVFKKLSKPFFSTYYEGEVEWGQDIVFGKSLIEAGIEVFCDLDVVIWHATHCSIGTVYENDQWKTIVRIAESNIKLNGD